jgi:hypothetical protein
MALAFLTLITGLAISAVAIYYSVIGLAAIFSAAVIPIIVMGSILEVSKLVTAWWLKANWYRAPVLLKSYMLIAVVVLMLITSMGIFGFLSKAHTDQSITTGDVQGKIALYDEKIKIERENIANAQQVIKQMDAAVNGVISTGDQEVKLRDGSTRINSAAERSLQIRRSQAKDRAALTKQIEEAQSRIVKLQEEAAPIRAEVRKVEAEVGPIKYIAKLIYGDSADTNLLEKAVTWVIITIVFVFDPLAVLLLLASQMSFQWAKQNKERTNELVQETPTPEGSGEEASATPQPIIGTVDERSEGQSQANQESSSRDDVAEKANREIAEIEQEEIKDDLLPEIEIEAVTAVEKDPLSEWNEMIAEAEKAAEEESQQEEQAILDNAHAEEKVAMQRWKSENPEGSLKIQRRLLEKGKIDKLPWEDYLKAHSDEEDVAAIEAAKWAQEQLNKKTEVTYIEKDGAEQVKKTTSYKQNEEQSEKTLWQRVKDTKND